MDKEHRRSVAVNYIYFGMLLSILILTFSSSMSVKQDLVGSKIFFFLYALGQATLETFLFVFLAWTVRRFIGKLPFALFIGVTFIFLILHILDFLLDRILDLSVWETLSFVFEESFSNFLYLLEASGVPMWAWSVFFILVAMLPLVGFFIYKGTNFFASKRPFFLKREWFFQAFLCIPTALFLWDYTASNHIPPDAYTAFTQSLPWKFTFIPPPSYSIPIKGNLTEPKTQEFLQASIQKAPAAIRQRPNIYLFIIESLREDCITADIAPNLTAFKNAYTHCDLSLSNANASHISWFSIFHSQFPHYWSRIQKENRSLGSPSLALLKKWGYKVRLYSSAQLGYYGMEELLFGKDRHLLDARNQFHHHPPLTASDTDKLALDQLQKDLSNPSFQEGQVFIVFWDTTHFDYSWPKDFPAKFTPYSKEFGYFHIFPSQKDIEMIKNRYRNSVHYMDSLFGEFFAHLPKKEEAIVIITGDHGEEFFDRGHLFHGSHLIHEQTNVPIYFKFGSNTRKPLETKLVSQIDIFPTLLDYLNGSPLSFLDGESLFHKKTWPFALLARFNASRTPYEFCLHNGSTKLTGRFANKSDVFHSKSIHLRSLRTYQDRSILQSSKKVEERIAAEFGKGLDRLSGQK